MAESTVGILGIAGTLTGLVLGMVIGLGVLAHRGPTPRCPYCRRKWRAARKLGAGRG